MPRRLSHALVLTTTLATACASGVSGPSQRPSPTYSEESWIAVRSERPAPVPGAPRVAQAAVTGSLPNSTALGVGELVGARLLDRDDLLLLDRRRLSAAVERERQGLPRPPGAPPIGTPPGIEWLIGMTVAESPGDSVTLALRLTAVESGVHREAWQVVAPVSNPVDLARRLGEGVLDLLAQEGLVPEAGSDDRLPLGPVEHPEEAFRSFVLGVEAEDTFNWDAARAAYERASTLGGPGFPEPIHALARAARLRRGGSLAKS